MSCRPRTRGWLPSAASVQVEGKTYSTQPLTIEVVSGEAMPGQGGASAGGADKKAGAEARSGKLAPDDILLRVTVNRNNVYKGQPVRVAFKLYTRVQLSGIESVKYPAFNGFWAQELNVDGYSWQRETLNGKVYDARVVKEVLLYPQQSGTLHIEQSSMTVVAQIVVQSRSHSQSLFDDFFGGQSVQEVRKNLSAAPVPVTVRDFPAGAPASFNGAVGKFQLNGSLDKQTVTANASDTYLLKLSGSGNLPLIQAPKPELPASFESYGNGKSTESLSHNASGISGYKQFEFPFIPGRRAITRFLGRVRYFDPDAAKYVTLTTPPFGVEVLPDSTGGGSGGGIVSGIGREDLKILDSDIRFIRLGDSGLSRKGSLLFGSAAYFGMLAVLLALFVAVYLYLKKHLRDMRNVTLVRNRKASKVALQRLRAAHDHMAAREEKQFYEEMLRALWGYMSDKLNIPVANLTKDNIREEILRRGISAELANHYIGIISDCEYAQYSPSASVQMTELYGEAVRMLSKFESLIKK
ncbi:MAG: protein BatD [Alistipes sp.]